MISATDFIQRAQFADQPLGEVELVKKFDTLFQDTNIWNFGNSPYDSLHGAWTNENGGNNAEFMGYLHNYQNVGGHSLDYLINVNKSTHGRINHWPRVGGYLTGRTQMKYWFYYANLDHYDTYGDPTPNGDGGYSTGMSSSDVRDTQIGGSVASGRGFYMRASTENSNMFRNILNNFTLVPNPGVPYDTATDKHLQNYLNEITFTFSLENDYANKLLVVCDALCSNSFIGNPFHPNANESLSIVNFKSSTLMERANFWTPFVSNDGVGGGDVVTPGVAGLVQSSGGVKGAPATTNSWLNNIQLQNNYQAGDSIRIKIPKGFTKTGSLSCVIGFVPSSDDVDHYAFGTGRSAHADKSFLPHPGQDQSAGSNALLITNGYYYFTASNNQNKSMQMCEGDELLMTIEDNGGNKRCRVKINYIPNNPNETEFVLDINPDTDYYSFEVNNHEPTQIVGSSTKGHNLLFREEKAGSAEVPWTEVGAGPAPSAEVTSAISGTSIDAAVATAANAVVADVAVDAGDEAVNTASTTALQHFSSDAGFTNPTFTKAKKRQVFKNLMKQIVNLLTAKKFVMNDKTEFLKFVKPTDDTIDLGAKLKDKIEVIQPGTTNVTVNMDNASVYVPFGDGESQTFVDSVTGKEFTMGKTGSDFTLTVADSQGGAHSIPPNYTGVADQEGQVYTYVDVANNRETIFIWGSGTASSNNSTGQVQGDPYITTLAGVTYKMDDFTGFVRLLQGEYEKKTFTINAENKLLTKSEIKELLEWRQTKMQGMNFSDNVRFGKFPAYFSKFHVSHGDKYVIVDANSLQVLESNYESQMAHSVQINQGYVWSEALKTVSRADLTVGELQISMMSYEDKDIRNGFKLFNMDKLQNRSGALEHPIYVKDMKIRSIRSVVPIKQQSARKNKKVSKEEIIENGLKTQHTFRVF